MKEFFEQWTKTMEKMWAPWQDLTRDAPWLQKPELPFQGNWSSWIAAMRSTYEVNTSWWQTFMEQGENLFFKLYKESPLYNQTVEGQIREIWENIKKAQAAQTDTVKSQFEKMEAMLKEKEEAS